MFLKSNVRTKPVLKGLKPELSQSSMIGVQIKPALQSSYFKLRFYALKFERTRGLSGSLASSLDCTSSSLCGVRGAFAIGRLQVVIMSFSHIGVCEFLTFMDSSRG